MILFHYLMLMKCNYNFVFLWESMLSRKIHLWRSNNRSMTWMDFSSSPLQKYKGQSIRQGSWWRSVTRWRHKCDINQKTTFNGAEKDRRTWTFLSKCVWGHLGYCLPIEIVKTNLSFIFDKLNGPLGFS